MDDIICRFNISPLEPTPELLEDYTILNDRYLALAACRELHKEIIQAITGQMFELSQQMRMIETEYPLHTLAIREFTKDT